MLALTEAANGDITGVLTTDILASNGQINTNSISITRGAFDGGQLTLSLQPSTFGDNISGTKNGNTIHFDLVGSQGQVNSSEFVLASGTDFKTYVEELAAKGKSIAASIQLLKSAQNLARISEHANQWITEANTHVQRISGTEDRFLKLEEKMRRLVELERNSHNGLQRSQISVEVNQVDVEATQGDIEVNNFWEENVEKPGFEINAALATYEAACRIDQSQKLTIAPDTLQSWKSACLTLQTAHSKFDPIYKQTLASRNDERSFQASEREHRKMLVEESNRLDH